LQARRNWIMPSAHIPPKLKKDRRFQGRADRTAPVVHRGAPRESSDLILVTRRNRAIGHADKATVHAEGLRHRAFSIFLVDSTGRLLLQRRSRAKYHSGGLWANSCCGHPSPHERTQTSARRRLSEELGVSVRLTFGFLTHYQTAFPNGLQENEVVHVYFGRMPIVLHPNRDEVMETALLTLAGLEADVLRHPDRYAFWLRHYLKHHRQTIETGLRGIVG